MRRRYAKARERNRDASQFLLSCYRLTLLSFSLFLIYLLSLSMPHILFIAHRRWWQQDQVSNGKRIQRMTMVLKIFSVLPPKNKNARKMRKKREEAYQEPKICKEKCHIFHSLVLPNEKEKERKYRNQRPLMRHVHFHRTHTHSLTQGHLRTFSLNLKCKFTFDFTYLKLRRRWRWNQWSRWRWHYLIVFMRIFSSSFGHYSCFAIEPLPKNILRSLLFRGLDRKLNES